MRRNRKYVSTKLRRIVELAKKDKQVKFTSLAHHLTPEFLKESFLSLNRKAAPGVDGVTMEEFREELDANIETLWTMLKEGEYRATSVRRKYIPKSDGKLRPLGIPTVRDRVVQRATGEIIGAVYEPYFCDCSYGFRPGRSAHDALESLRLTINQSKINYVVEADIKGYFDNVNHKWLMKFLRHRIVDRTVLRLVAKWLKAGIMDNGVVVRDDKGTPQGGPISPLLANIYLHYVLDLWFERRFRRTCEGQTFLVRYADDFVTCFESKDEAYRFLEELRERFAEFGLELSEEKTGVMEFGKNSRHNGKRGPGKDKRTFEFLGYTHYMCKSRKSGYYYVAKKPCRKSRNRFLKRVSEWCKDHRHLSVHAQARRIKKMLQGYFNYFGLSTRRSSLGNVKWHVRRLWIKALRKRSQRHKLTWNKIMGYLWFQLLPEPKLRTMTEAISGSRMRK